MFNELFIDMTLNNVKMLNDKEIKVESSKSVKTSEVDLKNFLSFEEAPSLSKNFFNEKNIYKINEKDENSYTDSNQYRFGKGLAIATVTKCLANNKELFNDITNIEKKPESNMKKYVMKKGIDSSLKYSMVSENIKNYFKNESIKNKMDNNTLEKLNKISEFAKLNLDKIQLSKNLEEKDKTIKSVILSNNEKLINKSITGSNLNDDFKVMAVIGQSNGVVGAQKTGYIPVSSPSSTVTIRSHSCHANCHAACHGSRGWR